MHAGARPDGVEQARHYVDLHLQVAQRTHDADERIVSLVREGEEDAIDIPCAHDLGDLSRRPEDRQLLDVVADLLRLRIDEAEHAEAELGVLEELPRDELPDLAGPDDDRLLRVRRAPPN